MCRIKCYKDGMCEECRVPSKVVLKMYTKQGKTGWKCWKWSFAFLQTGNGVFAMYLGIGVAYISTKV